jgi:hypothetical protein
MAATYDRSNDPQARIERFWLAAHRLAFVRLRENPQRVNDLLATISRGRAQGSLTHSEPYMKEWERLLSMPLDEMERSLCPEDDHATVLRTVSPIGLLITPEERERLRKESRHA